MNNKEILRNFCQSHNINVLSTSKRAHKHTRVNVKYFQFNDDYNRFTNDYITLETEPLYTIEITESELERIAEFENQVFNNMRQQGHYNLFETLMEQKEKEKYLRDKYPAVKKAYEQYSLILKLAESGEL